MADSRRSCASDAYALAIRAGQYSPDHGWWFLFGHPGGKVFTARLWLRFSRALAGCSFCWRDNRALGIAIWSVVVCWRGAACNCERLLIAEVVALSYISYTDPSALAVA